MTEALGQSVADVRQAGGLKPDETVDHGLVLGSGLNPIADTLTIEAELAYGDISGFAKSLHHGHRGRLLLARWPATGVRCWILQGRFHLYQNLSVEQVTYPIELLAALGVRNLLLTNSAGGIRDDLKPGSLMCINDQINWTHSIPLNGRENSHVDMERAYDPAFVEILLNVANKQGLAMQQGVYLAVPGPTYETPAEVRLYRTLGADAVGMSTVLETIVARYHGLRVAGISAITNRAAGLSGQQAGATTLDHNHVIKTAGLVHNDLHKILSIFFDEVSRVPS